jgi:hypothetical protein
MSASATLTTMKMTKTIYTMRSGRAAQQTRLVAPLSSALETGRGFRP